MRIIQFTPPGSGCSANFGQGITTAVPGSIQGGLVVSDIEVAYKHLAERGVEVSGIFHGAPFPPAHTHPSTRGAAHIR